MDSSENLPILCVNRHKRYRAHFWPLNNKKHFKTNRKQDTNIQFDVEYEFQDASCVKLHFSISYC